MTSKRSPLEIIVMTPTRAPTAAGLGPMASPIVTGHPDGGRIIS